MRQRNDTGYPLLVQPEGSPQFELAPNATVDYPDPIPGCSVIPTPENAPPKPAAKKTPAKPADGGDPA